MAAWNASKVKQDHLYLAGACENGVMTWLKQKDRLTKGQHYLEDRLHPDNKTVPRNGDSDYQNDVSCGLAVEIDTTEVEVKEFVDTLDERERIVLRLKLDERTMDEIAQAIGQSRQTVDAVLQKIRQKYTDWS